MFYCVFLLKLRWIAFASIYTYCILYFLYDLFIVDSNKLLRSCVKVLYINYIHHFINSFIFVEDYEIHYFSTIFDKDLGFSSLSCTQNGFNK